MASSRPLLDVPASKQLAASGALPFCPALGDQTPIHVQCPPSIAMGEPPLVVESQLTPRLGLVHANVLKAQLDNSRGDDVRQGYRYMSSSTHLATPLHVAGVAVSNGK